MDAFWEFWNGLTPTFREGIIVGILGGVGVAAVTGVFKLFGVSLLAGVKRLFKRPPPPAQPLPPQTQPLPPPSQLEVLIKVEPSQPPAPQQPPPPPPALPPLGDAALPSNVPRPPVVGFVARRDEKGREILECLREELDPAKDQLVALWGAGGVGKTTLAVESVRVLGEVFGARVVWTGPELRADFTFSTLLDETAAQLGRADLRPLPLEQKEGQVRALLGEAPALVVLDNFETVADGEQPVCVRWLAQSAPCPVLVTTRQRIEGAHNVAIGAMSPAEAQEFVGRWIDREAHGPPAFEGLDRGRVIEAADRNPRVLEWVLARIDLAGEPEAVLAELARGEGDAALRVFDGSFNLPQLGDDGRDALLALSLFVPDASREALAEAAGFGDDVRRLNEAVTRLASLWLVKATPGNKRLTLEGLTRELAKSRLGRDARAVEFRRRFVAFFLRYAEAHRQPTREDFDALETEKDNLLGAMDAAFEMKDWPSLMRIRRALEDFLDLRGYWDEAIQRSEQAVRAARVDGSDLAGARFAASAAKILVRRGEYAEARRRYEELLAEFRRLGSEVDVAGTLHQLGAVAHYQSDWVKARQFYETSLGINRRIGNAKGIAWDLHQLGRLAQGRKDGLAEARRLYEESLLLSRELNDLSHTASTLRQLGSIAQKLGDLPEARRLYEESLRIRQELGGPSGIASVTSRMGLLLLEQGEIKEAETSLEKSLTIRRGIKNQQGAVIDLHWLGVIAQRQGDPEKARRLYTESLEIATGIGNQVGIAKNLLRLGQLEEEQGNKPEAVRLFRQALFVFEKLGSYEAEKPRAHLFRIERDGP